MGKAKMDSLEAYLHDLLTEESGSRESTRAVNADKPGSKPPAATVEKNKPDNQDPPPVTPPKPPEAPREQQSLNSGSGYTSQIAHAQPKIEMPDIAAQAEQDIRLLEEHKRQKLQEMLSRNSLPKVKPPEPKVEVKVETKPKVREVQKPLAAPQVEQTQADPLVDASVVNEPAPQPVKGVLSLLEWAANGRPVWAQNDFDALFFQVSGLTLAVPLVALGQIVKLDRRPTPIAGQSEWFMGVMHTPIGDIRTVNTALFVMPERYNPEFVDKAEFLISIDGLPWGLAVDKVQQPVRLSPADVHWRSERGRRPWLAGTVKARMCALLDIPQMAHLLNQADKNYR